MDAKRGRKGFIAVVALPVMAILLLVGVTFLSTATTENTMVANEINGQKAFNIAEAGIDHAKRVLLGANLNTVLANNGATLFGGSNSGPISFPDGTNGTYNVTVSNNNVCAGNPPTFMGKPCDTAGSNATTDLDGVVVVESTGTYTRNGTTATRVIRALIQAPPILNPPSLVFTLNGTTNPRDTTGFTFSGNNFRIQGRDTDPCANSACTNTTPICGSQTCSGGVAVPALGVQACPTCDSGKKPFEEATDAVRQSQPDQITGAGTDPSIQVVTTAITADYLANTLKPFLTAHATVTCTGGSISNFNGGLPNNCTGSSANFGTPANPQITVVNGALQMQGSPDVTGFGILLVTGNLKMTGGASFHGIIIVDGDDGGVEFSGNSNVVWGAIIQINRSGSNGGETRLNIKGGGEGYYSKKAIDDFANPPLSSATTLAWSENP